MSQVECCKLYTPHLPEVFKAVQLVTEVGAQLERPFRLTRQSVDAVQGTSHELEGRRRAISVGPSKVLLDNRVFMHDSVLNFVPGSNSCFEHVIQSFWNSQFDGFSTMYFLAPY